MQFKLINTIPHNDCNASSFSSTKWNHYKRWNPIQWSLRLVLLLAVQKAATRCGFSSSFDSFPFLRHSRIVCLQSASTTHVELLQNKNNYNYTVQYAPTFRRHVVRCLVDDNDDSDDSSTGESSRGRVIQSFLWLDEARARFPNARLLPVESPLLPLWSSDNNNKSDGGSTSRFIGLDDTVAGGMVWDAKRSEFSSYPSPLPPLSSTTRNSDNCFESSNKNNKQAIVSILESHLRWFPSQAERLIQAWPDLLLLYAPSELSERIQFLLAPLVDHTVLQQVNYTEDIDWPVLFYSHGRGAGMSLAQVSHALQTVPQFLLRTWPQAAAGDVKQLMSLYEQTPPAVSEMTHVRLEAWLAGTSVFESAMLAYLHWKGWEWSQCRLLLHAWPCLLQPVLEAGWEVHERGGIIRKKLVLDALQYLQARLQLRPWHIQAMFKTHSRLTGYNKGQLQRNMDYLQASQNLSSADLRKVLLQMPSLLGASIDGLQERSTFWIEAVGLTAIQLREAALKKPSILQYSVAANLKPKFVFFSVQLKIDSFCLVQLTKSHPDIWAYSLERKLRPSCSAFISCCGSNMTMADYGNIVVKAPDILRCNWNANLRVKLQFLQRALNLSPKELTALVTTSPRVLLHSAKSLEAKINLLEQAGTTEGHLAVQRNPSLLLIALGILKTRIKRVSEQSNQECLSDALAQPAKGRARGSQRTVALFSTDGASVEHEFTGAADAARHAGTSVSNMYEAIRNARLLKGRMYAYTEIGLNGTKLGTVRSKNESLSSVKIQEDLTRLQVQVIDSQSTRLTIIVSGVAFPPESGVRGRRRSGGMALQIPTWSINNWREPCSTIWKGQNVRLLSDRQTAILGYPFIRPSRPRCCLYVCREAIRVASQWLSSVETPSADIEIMSDSSYVVELLRNTTQVLDWGSAETRSEFTYTGEGPSYRANPDILYPVARSLYHLMNQEVRPNGRKTKVVVRFTSSDQASESYRRTLAGAKLAAKLMYDRSRISE
jgi:hypothetical protein